MGIADGETCTLIGLWLWVDFGFFFAFLFKQYPFFTPCYKGFSNFKVFLAAKTSKTDTVTSTKSASYGSLLKTYRLKLLFPKGKQRIRARLDLYCLLKPHSNNEKRKD